MLLNNFNILALLATTLHYAASTADVPTVGFAWLGGTTGGSAGQQTTVSTLEDLVSACNGDLAKIVVVSALTGIGLYIDGKENVIIRNMKISKHPTRIWIDHVDLSSDLDHWQTSMTGLIDLTHAVTFTTITSSFLHDHFKGSLVGHSDANTVEDSVMTVTYALNYWKNLNSRTPVFRAGHGHIFNSFFETNNAGIDTRAGAQLLVENNVWSGGLLPLYSTGNGGYAVARGNDFDGAGTNTAPVGNFTYSPVYGVRARVTADAGQTLAF
ncbi:polysaccharide lyase family 1 protein [Flagelloscypha sp. PMI_526]|nr:polysaccharide lyase family 1 protein [Flagelloscypha sp. PMI_526]